MSLEEAFADLAKAIREQTEVLRGGMAKASSAKAETTAKADTAKAKGSTKPKGPALADLKATFSDYIASVPKTDGTKRKEITDNVKAILDHFGVKQASAIPQESWAEAIGYVEAFKAGETPSFMNEDGGSDDGESLV